MNFKYEIDLDTQLYKYSEYIIKKINEKEYIFPVEEAQLINLEIKNKFSDVLIDLLCIGDAVYHNGDNVDELALEFVTKYGLLGFINYFPVNSLYFLDKEIVLKHDNVIEQYMTKTDVISYIRIFMPDVLNQEILDKIEAITKSIKSNKVSEDVISMMDKKFIYSRDYGEPLEMITNYAKQLYEDLLAIQNEEETKLNTKCIAVSFEGGTDKELILKYEYLKSAVDAIFVSEVTNETRRLKICRYCGKAFMAVNPKAEYDTPQCKNKANVYKFRSKER